MASEASQLLTFEEFLEQETDSGFRSEFVGGQAFAMAGGTERHDLLAGLLYEAIAANARAEGCRPFISNRLVKVDRAAYYPDVMVVCGPATHQQHEKNPTLVIEVLSPSTLGVDKREKALAFTGLPSLFRYVLADPYYRRIETAHLENDTMRMDVFGPGFVLDLKYALIEIDDIYDQLDASASLP